MKPGEQHGAGQDVAELAKPALDAVRNVAADQRRQADRRRVGEIIAVDAAEIDIGDLAAAGQYLGGAGEIERDAERARKTVRGAERQYAEHRVAVREIIDDRADRPVAAADNDQLVALRDRALHDFRQADRIAHRIGGLDVQPVAGQEPLGVGVEDRARCASGC